MRCHQFFCTIVLSCPLAWSDSPGNDFVFKPTSLFGKTDLSLALESLVTYSVNNELCVMPAINDALLAEYPYINTYLQSRNSIEMRDVNVSLGLAISQIINAGQSYIFAGLDSIYDRSQRERILLFFFSDPELLQRVRELNEDAFKRFLEAYLGDRRVLDLLVAVARSEGYNSAYPEEQRGAFVRPSHDSDTFFVQQIAAILSLRQNTGAYFSFLIPWLLCQDDISEALQGMLAVYPQRTESGDVNRETMLAFLSRFIQSPQSPIVPTLANMPNINQLTNLRFAIASFLTSENSVIENNDYHNSASYLIFLLTREPLQRDYPDTFYMSGVIGLLSGTLGTHAGVNFEKLDDSSCVEWLMGLAQYPAIQDVLHQIAPSLSSIDLTAIMSRPQADLHSLWIARGNNVDSAIRGFLLLPLQRGMNPLLRGSNLARYILYSYFTTTEGVAIREGAAIRMGSCPVSENDRPVLSVADLLIRLDQAWYMRGRRSADQSIASYPSKRLFQLQGSDMIRAHLEAMFNRGFLGIYEAVKAYDSSNRQTTIDRENDQIQEALLASVETNRYGLSSNSGNQSVEAQVELASLQSYLQELERDYSALCEIAIPELLVEQTNKITDTKEKIATLQSRVVIPATQPPSSSNDLAAAPESQQSEKDGKLAAPPVKEGVAKPSPDR